MRRPNIFESAKCLAQGVGSAGPSRDDDVLVWPVAGRVVIAHDGHDDRVVERPVRFEFVLTSRPDLPGMSALS